MNSSFSFVFFLVPDPRVDYADLPMNGDPDIKGKFESHVTPFVWLFTVISPFKNCTLVYTN